LVKEFLLLISSLLVALFGHIRPFLKKKKENTSVHFQHGMKMLLKKVHLLKLMANLDYAKNNSQFHMLIMKNTNNMLKKVENKNKNQRHLFKQNQKNINQRKRRMMMTKMKKKVIKKEKIL